MGKPMGKPMREAVPEAVCSRCTQMRWPDPGHAEPYVCQRCRAVLAGKNAVDPLGSPAQQEARKRAGLRGKERFGRGKQGTSHLGEG